MKVTSRRTTYPRMSMIQRWTREKSAGDQTALQVHFLFVFHDIPDDDFCHTYCVPSNLSGQLVEVCNENNISKYKHDPTVDSRDMATGALLVFSKICSSLPLSAFLYFFLFFFFFFFNWWPLCSFIGTFFFIITILSLFHAFMYFILFFM